MQHDGGGRVGFAVLRKVQAVSVTGVEHLLVEGVRWHALFYGVGDKMVRFGAQRQTAGVCIKIGENAAAARENSSFAWRTSKIDYAPVTVLI
jgi:hypothetical protein